MKINYHREQSNFPLCFFFSYTELLDVSPYPKEDEWKRLGMTLREVIGPLFLIPCKLLSCLKFCTCVAYIIRKENN